MQQSHPTPMPSSSAPQSLLPFLCLIFNFLHLIWITGHSSILLHSGSTHWALGNASLNRETRNSLEFAVQGKMKCLHLGWQSATGSLVNPVNNTSSTVRITTVDIVFMGPPHFSYCCEYFEPVVKSTWFGKRANRIMLLYG